MHSRGWRVLCDLPDGPGQAVSSTVDYELFYCDKLPSHPTPLPYKVQIELYSLPCAAPSEDDLSSSINSCVLEQHHCHTPCQQVGPLSAVVPPQTLYQMLIGQFQMFLWSDRPAGCWEKLSGGYGNLRTLIPSTTSNISIQCFQKTKWSQRAIKAS